MFSHSFNWIHCLTTNYMPYFQLKGTVCLIFTEMDFFFRFSFGFVMRIKINSDWQPTWCTSTWYHGLIAFVEELSETPLHIVGLCVFIQAIEIDVIHVQASALKYWLRSLHFIFFKWLSMYVNSHCHWNAVICIVREKSRIFFIYISRNLSMKQINVHRMF